MMEVGAGVPRQWAEGFARLKLARPAPGFLPQRWRQIIDDGGKFLDRWGAVAAGLGWSSEDVFGVDPAVPAVRYDAMGLVPLIGGGTVTKITEHAATIRRESESELVYLRCPGVGGVALWDLQSDLSNKSRPRQ